MSLAAYRETQARPELADAIAIRAAREEGTFLVHEEMIRRLTDLPSGLGDGEAAAISLASEMGCGVIMDERTGRAIARVLGI